MCWWIARQQTRSITHLFYSKTKKKLFFSVVHVSFCFVFAFRSWHRIAVAIVVQLMYHVLFDLTQKTESHILNEFFAIINTIHILGKYYFVNEWTKGKQEI